MTKMPSAKQVRALCSYRFEHLNFEFVSDLDIRA